MDQSNYMNDFLLLKFLLASWTTSKKNGIKWFRVGRDCRVDADEGGNSGDEVDERKN